MSEIQYMVECTARDLIVLLVERNSIDVLSAVDAVYTSETYRLLSDKHSGLYFQSPYYVYEMLLRELDSVKKSKQSSNA